MFQIEWVRGSGPGGQHRNKTENACRLTDPATGLQAYADERSRRQSYRDYTFSGFWLNSR